MLLLYRRYIGVYTRYVGYPQAIKNMPEARLRDLLYTLPKNIAGCFSGYRILWHLLAIALTYVLVTSGFDWLYFESTRNTILESVGISAALIGFLVPVLLPLSLYIKGKLRKQNKTAFAGIAAGQAALAALFISSFYKAFTGRIQPELFAAHAPMVDISRAFHFGFLQHGLFWGWPSSHTTVAFAIAMSLITFYPKNKTVLYTTLVYAFFIGLGVSVSIHWFSDFAAGAIIGALIGTVVGRSFSAQSYTRPAA